MMVCANHNKAARPITALVAAVCATLCVTVAAQTIYKITDENGHITYTDAAPEAGSHTIEEYALAPPNGAIPVVPGAAAPPEADAPTRATPDYITVISKPADGATIAMGPGDFMVEVRTSPQLSAFERLQLEVDGSPFGPPQKDTQWQLTNVFRGAHGLRVIRVDETGDAIDTSEITTVFVLRPSVLK